MTRQVLDRHFCGNLPVGVCVEYYDGAWRIRTDSKNNTAVTHCPWCGNALRKVEPAALAGILQEVRYEIVEHQRSMDCAWSYVLGQHYHGTFRYCSEKHCDECCDKTLSWLIKAVQDMYNE